MMKSTIAALIVAGASACTYEWIEEKCSWMFWRDACDGEIYGDSGDECGWIYWDAWKEEEFEVTCNEYADWWWC